MIMKMVFNLSFDTPQRGSLLEGVCQWSIRTFEVASLVPLRNSDYHLRGSVTFSLFFLILPAPTMNIFTLLTVQ